MIFCLIGIHKCMELACIMCSTIRALGNCELDHSFFNFRTTHFLNKIKSGFIYVNNFPLSVDVFVLHIEIRKLRLSVYNNKHVYIFKNVLNYLILKLCRKCYCGCMLHNFTPFFV